MDKTVIITGASSGIGEALAYAAIRNGYNVVLAARSEDKLRAVAAQCEALGGKAIGVVCDVSKAADCEKMVQQAVDTFGRIDILINNAGISMRAVFNNCELSVIESVMNINFWGTVYCTKFALPHLLKTRGSLVAVSSLAGIKGLPGRTGYSASKFAIHGFMEALRIENLKKGLHVLVACPGYTASNIRKSALNNVGRNQAESPVDESKLMQPEEVANAIFKSIDKRQSYLYLTLQGKLVHFLNKFFPIQLDHIVFKTVAKEKDSPFV